MKIIADSVLRTNSTSAAWTGGGGEGGQEEGAGGGQGGQGQYSIETTDTHSLVTLIIIPIFATNIFGSFHTPNSGAIKVGKPSLRVHLQKTSGVQNIR